LVTLIEAEVPALAISPLKMVTRSRVALDEVIVRLELVAPTTQSTIVPVVPVMKFVPLTSRVNDGPPATTGRLTPPMVKPLIVGAGYVTVKSTADDVQLGLQGTGFSTVIL
jgi:hypothetical protein